MRLTIGKPQHRALLTALSSQLGSDRPIDALEHILNCWIVGNIPPPQSQQAIGAPDQPADDDDEFAGLIDF